MDTLAEFITTDPPKKELIQKTVDGGVNFTGLITKIDAPKDALNGKRPNAKTPAKYDVIPVGDATTFVKPVEKPKKGDAKSQGKPNAVTQMLKGEAPASDDDMEEGTAAPKAVAVVVADSYTVTPMMKGVSIKLFGPPPGIRVGEIYIFKQCIFDARFTFNDGATGFTAKAHGISMFPRAVSELMVALPFEPCAPNVERDFRISDDDDKYDSLLKDYSRIIMPIDNTKEGFLAMGQGEDIFAGQLILPEYTDNHLTRSSQNGPMTIGLTDGLSPDGQGRDPPRIRAILRRKGDAKPTSMLIHWGGFKSDFDAYQLDVETWVKLAPYLLRVMTGWITGSIRRDKTAAMVKPPNMDAAATLYANAIWDVAKTVERAGIEIEAQHIAQFLDGEVTNLRAEDPDIAAAAPRTVINLSAADGDATKIIAAVKAGTARCFVLARHLLSQDEIEQVKTYTPDDRVAVLLGEPTAKTIVKYDGKPYYAVYVVGPNVHQMLGRGVKPSKKQRKQ